MTHGQRHPQRAESLVRLPLDQGVHQPAALPPEILAERDPLAVLRFTAALGRPAVVHLIDEAMTREEVTAARTAQPTPYGREVIVAAHQTGRRVAVVSKNRLGPSMLTWPPAD
ncbi:hypothetical protein [Micromonospora coxensis]|uniref:hypothetical protein n=1 Tax=Micromonospora coxensis TaxID=356852 RepID=UPI001E473026|nr:hypothetical protein [Micromonospora coxensis]